MQQKGKAMIEIMSKAEHKKLHTLSFKAATAISYCVEEGIPGEAVTLETRHDSFEVVDREQRYKQIIEIMAEHPERPLSAKEIAVFMHRKGFTPTEERNFSAPRLTELSQKGVVEPCGKIKCLYTGKTVAVYRLIN